MLDLETLEELRCNTCHNYLSVLPVFSYGGEQNVCGRCPVDQNFIPQEAILYETVIKNFDFPCQYEMRGCTEKVKPVEMKLHEATCSYRPFSCPSLIDECDFSGGLDEITTHFQNDHPESIFASVELDVVNAYEKNYIYSENNDTFIVSLKCDKFDGQLYVQVKYLNSEKMAEDFSFTLKFHTKHDNTLYNVLGNVTYSELKHIQLDKPHQKILIEDLKNYLNNPAMILCDISMNRSQNAPSRNPSEAEIDLLLSLECPVCFHHMVPPILQCVRGHSYCKQCHAQLSTCPQCRDAMCNSQNFVLEALALKIGRPCKYQKFDCPYFGSGKDVAQHETCCSYGPCLCIFDGCSWNDKFEKLLHHVKTCHHDDFLDMNIITYIISPGCEETRTYVLYKFGNLFKIVFKEDSCAFRWNLQLIGPDTNHSKYILELDIKSPISSERIYYKKRCNSQTNSEDAFLIRDCYIELTHDSLDGFIEEDFIFVYSCNVAQI